MLAALAAGIWMAASGGAQESAPACEASLDELERELRQVRRLLEEKRTEAQTAGPPTPADLARRIDALEREVAQLSKESEEQPRHPSQHLVDTLREERPMRVEPAEAREGLEVDLVMLAEEQGSSPRWVARPDLSWGLARKLELGASLDAGVDEGEATILPARLYALGALLTPTERRPAISLKAEAITGSKREPFQLLGTALFSQTLGMYRLDLNAGYRFRRSDHDALHFAAGVTRGVKQRALVLADAWYEPSLGGGSDRGGGELGAVVEIGEHAALQASAGLGWQGRDVLARVLAVIAFDL